MEELSHIPCPHPDCSSTDAFSYNKEKQVGYCHSCGEGYPAKGVTYDDEYLVAYPINSFSKEDEEGSYPMAQTNVVPIEKHTVHREYRGITEDTMGFYAVGTAINSHGESIEQYYIYPSGGRKIRTLPKIFKADRGFKADELFGMQYFNAGCAKACTITEGELDAMSAYQMLGSKYPVVSLPSATPSKRMFEKCKDWLGSFERIYVSFDSDGKSDAVAAKLCALFPNKIYRVAHDKYKDANEFLMDGATYEYRNAWYNANKFTPENVFNTTEQFLSIYNEGEDSKYLPTGIEALDNTILGLMQGHFTIFQAPEGIGKTEFMRFLEYNILKNHPDVPIAIWHNEESKRRSLLGLVSYDLGLNLTRKDLVEAHDMETDVESSITRLTKNGMLYQFTMGVDDDPMELLDRIRFFATACECRYIFFEPIQDLGYSKHGDGTLEQFLSELSTKLARLASELNVGIVTIAHENDEGQIRDCRMIGKRASVVVKLARDKFAESDKERNTTTLTVIKNRPAGTTGFGGQLLFDPDSFTLSETYPTSFDED